MNRLLKIGAMLTLLLMLGLSVAPALAASGSQVRDDGGLFIGAARQRLQEFASAMQVPAVVITSNSFSGSKSDFINEANSNLPSNGVLIAVNSREGSRYYVVLIGSRSGLSSSDQQNAYNAGVQYLRASSRPQYTAAVFSSLYSLDAALGGQASDAVSVSGAPGSGFVPSSGGGGTSGGTSSGGNSNNPPPVSGGTNNGGGFSLGGLFDIFGTCLCIAVIGIFILAMLGSTLFSNNRARRRQQQYGGYGGYNGGYGGGPFGGGGFFPIPIPFGGGGGGNNAGGNNAGNDPTGTSFGGGGGDGSNYSPPANAGGGTFESPFGSSSSNSGGGGSFLSDIFGGGGSSGSSSGGGFDSGSSGGGGGGFESSFGGGDSGGGGGDSGGGGGGGGQDF